MDSRELISLLPQHLAQIEKVKAVTRLGMCREWTSCAMTEIENLATNLGLKVLCEAREVTISPGLSHTFIKVLVEDERPILCDGVGVGKYPSFIGYEDEAPEHLKNSKSDMINIYRKLKFQGQYI